MILDSLGPVLGRSWAPPGALGGLMGVSWGLLGTLLSPLPSSTGLGPIESPNPPNLLSTPYRTSTSLNLTPLNSTQLTSLFDPPWPPFWTLLPPQIGPRSAQDRTKSPLEALFFKNVKFHETSAGVVSGAFPGHPRGPKIDPRRLQDDLQDLLFSSLFLSWILVCLGSDFGSILAPLWDPKSAQVPRLSRPC